MSRILTLKSSSGKQDETIRKIPLSPQNSVNRLLVKKTHQFPNNSSGKSNVKTVSQQHTRLLLSSNKKDTTAESSSFERLESSHNCSEEEQYRKQILKPFAPHNGPRITDLCQNDKAKIGELMKKLASEKEEKENLQRELKMKETDYETTIVNLQRENQGMLQETRDLQNEFKTSINLLKTVDALTSKQRQQKLFSNLIYNRDQASRTYNYRDSKLIAHHDNAIQESNYSSYNPATEKDRSNLTSAQSQKFRELEADLELYERRNKVHQTADNFGAKERNQEVSSHEFNIAKYQNLQRENNLLSPRRSLINPPTTTYSQNEIQVRSHNGNPKEILKRSYVNQESPMNLPPTKLNVSSSNYLEYTSTNPQGKEKDLFYLNRGHSHPYTMRHEEREDHIQNLSVKPAKHERYHEEEIYENPNKDSQYSSIGNKSSPKSRNLFDSQGFLQGLQSKGSNLSNPYIHSGNHETNTKKKVAYERSNTEPSYSHYESKFAAKDIKEKDHNTQEGVIDIHRMNVKELIELKNIIDERIEIEELKNKKSRLKSPQRVLQKADEIIRSPENQKYSFKKQTLRQSDIHDKRPIRDHNNENFRKSDGFQQSYYDQRLNNDQYQTPHNRQIKNKMYQSSSNLFYSGKPADRKTNLNEGTLETNDPTQTDMEKLYDKKLKELLQIREMMMKMDEVSSTEIELPGPQEKVVNEPPTLPSKIHNHTLLSSTGLFQYTSPTALRSPTGELPRLSARDLLPSPIQKVTQPSRSPQNQKSGQEKDKMSFKKNYETNEKPIIAENDSFSFAEHEAIKKSSFFESENKGKSSSTFLLEKYLMKQANNATPVVKLQNKQKAAYSEDPKEEKEDSRAIMKKVQDLLEATNDSIEDISKEELYQKYSRLNKDLYQMALEKTNKGSTNTQVQMRDDDTLNLNYLSLYSNINSRTNSSVVETDLSLMAINKKIDEMRSNYDDKFY